MAVTGVNPNYINDVSHLNFDKGTDSDRVVAKQVLQDIGTLTAGGTVPSQGQFIADIQAGAHESVSMATQDANTLQAAIGSHDMDTLNMYFGLILDKVESNSSSDSTRLTGDLWGASSTSNV